MSEPLIKALISRIEIGEAKEATKGAVLAEGYSLDEFETAYNSALNRLSRDASQNDPTTPTSPAASLAQDTSSNSHDTKGKKVVTVVIVSLIVLVIGVIALAVTIKTGAFTSLFSNPPYSQADFIEGIGYSIGEMKSASFVIQSESTFEDKGTPATNDTELNTTFPQPTFSGSSTLQFNGWYNFTSLENVHFESNLDLDVFLSDGSHLGTDAEFKLINPEGLFIKVNEIELGIFALFIPNLKKIEGQWIKITDESDLQELRNIPNFQKKLMLDMISDLYKQLITTISATGVITLSREPEKIEFGDKTAYRYTIYIESEAVPLFIDEFSNHIKSEYGGTFSELENFITNDLSKFLATENIKRFNDSTVTSLIVSPEGTLLGIELNTQFSHNSLPNSYQISQKNTAIFTQHNEDLQGDGIDEFITAEEAIEIVPVLGQFSQKRVEKNPELEAFGNALREAAKQGILTGTIEYTDTCTYLAKVISEKQVDVPETFTAVTSCKEDTDSFSLQFEYEDVYYCIDSKGYAEWSPYPMMTGASCAPIDPSVFKNATPSNDDKTKASSIFTNTIAHLPSCGTGNRPIIFDNETIDSLTFDSDPDNYTFYAIDSGGYIIEDKVPCRGDILMAVNIEVFTFPSGNYLAESICTKTNKVAERFKNGAIYECSGTVSDNNEISDRRFDNKLRSWLSSEFMKNPAAVVHSWLKE